MAAFEVIALDTATPQLRAPGASDTYTFPRAVEMPLGTANGVLYLNGSKVATSGSALTFDGTNLGVGATAVYGGLYGTIHAYSASGATIRLDRNGAGTSTIQSVQTGVAYRDLTLDAANNIFSINGSEQMRLTSTGLGIGTSSPESPFQVASRFRVQSDGVVRWGSDVRAVAYNESGYLSWNTGVVRIGYQGSGAVAFGNSAAGDLMRLDSSGNLGLGVIASAWASGWRAFQTVGGNSFYSDSNVSSLASNAIFDGAWKYFNTAGAGTYQIDRNVHKWFTAPSGTAGNAISFTQALTLSSNSPFLTGTNLESGSNSFGIGTTGAAILGFFTNNTERARIKSTGQLRFVPLAADPAGAEAGDVYYNSGTNKLRLYDGSTWVDLN